MPYQIRNNVLLFYRLFFIVLFLLLGVSCIGTVGLEYYADVDIIATESDFDEQALHTTLLVMGLLGLIVATIMIYLMQERRSPQSDRRQLSKSLDFTDRRSSTDRRS